MHPGDLVLLESNVQVGHIINVYYFQKKKWKKLYHYSMTAKLIIMTTTWKIPFLFSQLVCQEPIKQSEWSRYVPSSMVEQYEKYNQPYRPFSRYCSSCRVNQVAPCQSPRSQGLSRQKRIEKIATLMNELQKSTDRIQLSWLDPLLRPNNNSNNNNTSSTSLTIGRIQTLYHQMTPVLRQAAQDPRLYSMASELSKQLVALEIVPEAWKRAQFWHIGNFPIETW